jgi:hypothetical protein
MPSWTRFHRKEAIVAAWSLSDKEWDALDRLRFGTSEAQLIRNGTIILMSAAGRCLELSAG